MVGKWGENGGVNANKYAPMGEWLHCFPRWLAASVRCLAIRYLMLYMVDYRTMFKNYSQNNSFANSW